MPRTVSFGGALEIVSLLYLALPWFVFAFGWLRLPYAFLLWIVLAVALLEQARRVDDDSPRDPFARPDWLELGALVLIVAVWTALSGAGGWGYQNLDWNKHDMMLRDLIEHPWPVDYLFVRAEGSTAVPLVYYVAYYLPAALFGKLAGWRAANEALFGWTIGGATLAALWFGRLSRHNVFSAALLFICLGGLDVIGFLLWSERPLTATTHLEWWAGVRRLQYSSNTSLLFWVPQHALAGWILTGLFLHQADSLRTCRGVLFAVGLCALWSPFVALGLVPFALAAALFCRFRGALSFANVGGGPALLFVATAFLLARREPLPHGWWFEGASPADWTMLAAFYVLEFGLIGILCMPARDAPGTSRGWWWVAIASLVALPLYRIGFFNDFTMRASIPALFVLWVFVSGQLLRRPWDGRARFLAAVVLLGAGTAGTEIARSIAKYPARLPDWGDVGKLTDKGIARSQYLGDPEAWFSRSLGTPTREVLTIEAEAPLGPASAVTVRAASDASGGKVARIAREDLSIVYGFDTSRSMADPTLLTRYTTKNDCSLAIFLDAGPAAEIHWAATGGRWTFAGTPLQVEPLSRGFHRLTLRGCAGAELDMLILARDPQGHR